MTLEAPPLPIHVDNQSWQDMTGTLPATLPENPSVTYTVTDYSHNQISGSLPPTWGSETMEVMDFSFNKLSGAFPATWWRSFPALGLLSLYNNGLQGRGGAVHGSCTCLLGPPRRGEAGPWVQHPVLLLPSRWAPPAPPRRPAGHVGPGGDAHAENTP